MLNLEKLKIILKENEYYFCNGLSKLKKINCHGKYAFMLSTSLMNTKEYNNQTMHVLTDKD